MRLHLIMVEAGMGATEYKPPQSPGQLMADFYLLQLLGSSREQSNHRGQLLQQELGHVERVLVPYLRQHLLDKAGYSIVRELRHLFDATVGHNHSTPSEKRIRELLQSNGVGPELTLQLQRAAFDDRVILQPQLQDKLACARAGLQLFRAQIPGAQLRWDEEYGGPPWVKACQMWLQLYQAHTLSEMAIYCDYIYSLQHNGGALLDKNPEYKGAWVEKLLDLKFQSNEPERLLNYASGYMRKLGLQLLRSEYGRSWDSEKFGMSRENDLSRRLERIAQKLQQELRQLDIDARSDGQERGNPGATYRMIYLYREGSEIPRYTITVSMNSVAVRSPSGVRSFSLSHWDFMLEYVQELINQRYSGITLPGG